MLAAQDYWRWIGFLTRHPGRSLANDMVFNCAMAVALGIVFLTHVHSIAAVVGAWGLGATAGAIYGLRQYRVRPTFSGGLALIRNRWSFSKWLAANSLLTSAGNQAYVVIEGIFLGAAGLGGLNVAAALVWGPVGVLIQAGGSLGLPEAGRAYADKGWVGLRRVANIVTLAGLLSVGLWVAVSLGLGTTSSFRSIRPELCAPAGHRYYLCNRALLVAPLFGPGVGAKDHPEHSTTVPGSSLCLVYLSR